RGGRRRSGGVMDEFVGILMALAVGAAIILSVPISLLLLWARTRSLRDRVTALECDVRRIDLSRVREVSEAPDVCEVPDVREAQPARVAPRAPEAPVAPVAPLAPRAPEATQATRAPVAPRSHH